MNGQRPRHAGLLHRLLSTAIALVVAAVLLAGIIYMVRGLREAPVAEDVSLDDSALNASQRRRARQRPVDASRLVQAEVPWSRRGRSSAIVNLASVPRLPVHRDLARPDPVNLPAAALPWIRNAARAQPAQIQEARLPSIPSMRDPDHPQPAYVVMGRLPWSRPGRPSPADVPAVQLPSALTSPPATRTGAE